MKMEENFSKKKIDPLSIITSCSSPWITSLQRLLNCTRRFSHKLTERPVLLIIISLEYFMAHRSMYL